MPFKKTLILYVFMLLAFFCIDMIWLGLVAKNFYRRHLGFLLADTVNWPAAILFYLLFIAGLLVFAVRPTLLSGSALQSLALGAFLGLLCYATYDLTNLATVRNWPLIVTVVDLIWGSLLGASVSWLGWLFGRIFLKTVFN